MLVLQVLALVGYGGFLTATDVGAAEAVESWGLPTLRFTSMLRAGRRGWPRRSKAHLAT
jgi:hypothetical protein